MSGRLSERRTSYASIHPYYGYVCAPSATIDFGLPVPEVYGHGVLIKTDKNGFRNDNVPEAKPAGERWIGLFGGSAAFSILSSSNAATISGYLEEELNGSAGPGDGRVRVLNLALPGCQQPQQLIIFIRNLSLLDGVVTFDGYNEVTVPAYRNNGLIPEDFPYFPYYAALYSESANDDQVALMWLARRVERMRDGLPGFARSLSGWFFAMVENALRKRANRAAVEGAEGFSSLFVSDEVQRGGDVKELMRRGAVRWRESILMMRDIARARDIETLFTLQPIPEMNKPLTSMERRFVAEKEEFSKARLEGYSMLRDEFEKLRSGGVCCEDLGDVFAGIDDDIYGDITHFEDKGCRIVAGRIAETIRERWKTFR